MLRVGVYIQSLCTKYNFRFEWRERDVCKIWNIAFCSLDLRLWDHWIGSEQNCGRTIIEVWIVHVKVCVMCNDDNNDHDVCSLCTKDGIALGRFPMTTLACTSCTYQKDVMFNIPQTLLTTTISWGESTLPYQKKSPLQNGFQLKIPNFTDVTNIVWGYLCEEDTCSSFAFSTWSK